MTKCLHQLFRCKDDIPQVVNMMEGCGNCLTCTYDPENNKKCKCYIPVSFGSVEVVEKD